MNKSVEQKVQEALDSVNHLPRAEAPYFLFQKIEAKMKARKKTVWDFLSGYMTNPAIAFSGILLILIFNLFIIFYTSQSQSDQLVELATVEEYNMVSSTYDLENLNP